MPTIVTKTIKPSGGDYTSLNAWEAAQQANLTTLDEIRQAECYAMHDTSNLYLLGWTTDDTRYVRVYVPSAERHDGKWDTNKFRMSYTNSHPVYISANHARIEGLQIEITNANTNNLSCINVAGILAGGSDIRISDCIVRAASISTFTTYGFRVNDVDANVTLWNNIFYDFVYSTTAHIGATIANAGTVNFYNNTFHNCKTGLSRSFGTVTAINNVAQGCVTKGFTGTMTTSYNVTDLADGLAGTGDANSTEVAFVDEANDDFHLAANDTGAKDQGTNDPASGLFSTDIDGQTRSGTWDKGADEVLSAIITALRTLLGVGS